MENNFVKTGNKLLDGLWKRYWDLVDEGLDIFFETHAWLENPEAPVEITYTPRELQNTIEKEETMKAIKFEEFLIEEKRKKAIPPPVQHVLPLDNVANTVI